MPAPSTPMPPGCCWSGLGRATRLMRFLTALPKTYEAEVVLGTATSTLDASGEVTGTWDMDVGGPGRGAGGGRGPDRARSSRSRPWCRRSRSGVGDCTRWPARGSRSTGRPGRSPSTGSTWPRAWSPGVFRVEVECSSGTYVRVLAADLGVGARRWGPPPQPPAHPDRVVLGGGRPAGGRADPGARALPGPGPPGPGPGGGDRRRAAAHRPGPGPRPGAPRA